MTANKNQYKIEILDVALDVIEAMANHGGSPQSASDLSRSLGIHRNRAFRILRTLEARGYAKTTPQSPGNFQLSHKFIEIGERVRERINLRRVAEPLLIELATQTGDVAFLVIRYGASAICVDRHQGHHYLQVATGIGQPLPLHVGASPKILLAFLPPAERDELLDQIELTRYTENTIVSRDKLRERLELIQRQGYEIEEEEYEVGVYAIGAPVRDYSGRVIAGITIATPKIRYSPESRQQYVDLVAQTAHRLSSALGYVET